MTAGRQSTRARRGRGAKAPTPQPAPDLTLTLLLGLIVLVGAWAYATSFAGVFVLDDVRAIVRNETIRTLWPLSVPMSPPAGSTVSGRPIANLSFAVNYAFADGAGLDVWGYHFFNLAIHLAAALTLAGVVRRTLSSERLRPRFEVAAPYLATAVAVIWAVHPLQTAAVTYVVQRVESLMGLFYLLTLYCAIRAPEGPRARLWTAGAIVSCALGMATKETMVTAPIMVALWDRVFGRRDDRRARWPLVSGLAATWLIFAALVYHEHRAPSIDLTGATAWRYLLTQAAVVAHYVRLALVPSPLVFLHTWPLADSFREVAPQGVLLAALLALTLAGLLLRHPLGFAGAWFFLVLAPTSSVLPIVTEVAAEHRMYLPLAAVMACAVTGAYSGGRMLLARPGLDSRAARRAGVAAGVLLTTALVLGYGLATRARNRVYASEEALWGDTVGKQPANSRARVAYGRALLAVRRIAEAEAELQAAVQLDASDPNAHGLLGQALAAEGKLDAAIPHLERTLALRPGDVDAHRSLGRIYAMRRQDALAVQHLGHAVDAQQDDAALLAELAAILADSRDNAVRDGTRALGLAERAVRLTARRDAFALDVLSVAEASLGRFADAAATAREALALARAQRNQQLVSELEYRTRAYEELSKRR